MEEPETEEVQIFLTSKEDPVSMRLLGVCFMRIQHTVSLVIDFIVFRCCVLYFYFLWLYCMSNDRHNIYPN